MKMLEINKIYNEDCLIGLKKLDSDIVDLTVTSPPYDDLRKYNGYSFDFDAYRQIGNAVAVPMGRWVGSQIVKYFNGAR